MKTNITIDIEQGATINTPASISFGTFFTGRVIGKTVSWPAANDVIYRTTNSFVNLSNGGGVIPALEVTRIENYRPFSEATLNLKR